MELHAGRGPAVSTRWVDWVHFICSSSTLYVDPDPGMWFFTGSGGAQCCSTFGWEISSLGQMLLYLPSHSSIAVCLRALPGPPVSAPAVTGAPCPNNSQQIPGFPNCFQGVKHNLVRTKSSARVRSERIAPPGWS